MANGTTESRQAVPVNPYIGKTREELLKIQTDAGGSDNIKDKGAFRAAWKEAPKEKPLKPAPSGKSPAESLPWSLVPLKELDQYSSKDTYALMDRLEKDLGVKPPKGWDLLPLPELKTWLREQITSEQIRDRHGAFEKRKREERQAAGRNINVTNLHLREITERAIIALQNDNNPPKLFVRGGALIRIVYDEKGAPSIVPLKPPDVRHVLERAIDFSRLRGDGTERVIFPPQDVVQDLLASRISQSFPPLEGIIEAPVILPNGTITISPGYYHDLEMVYVPSPELHLPDIPDRPGPDDIARSVSLLNEIFEDFPFSENASRTNAIGALLTTVLRPVIPGHAPLALIDKPQAGTGATLMTEVIAIIATGRSGAIMTAPADESEWKKTVTALLSHGRTVNIIDNVEKRLASSALAAVLTSETWTDRILGQSATTTLTHHETWIVNGNNVEVGEDIARRVFWIRIDAHQALPWKRTNFHHPDLLQWIREERGRILAAVLTLARAWIQAGKPKPDGIPQMGSFEKWRGLVGGILVNAELKDFLGNLDQFHERSDIITTQWDSLLQTLKEQFPGSFTVKDVVALIDAERDDQQSSFDKSITRLSEVLPDDISLKDKSPTRALGKAFLKRVDHVFPSGIVLRKNEAREHNLVKWIIESAERK